MVSYPEIKSIMVFFTKLFVGTMKKRNYREKSIYFEKFSVIYISKERTNYISRLYYIFIK